MKFGNEGCKHGERTTEEVTDAHGSRNLLSGNKENHAGVGTNPGESSTESGYHKKDSDQVGSLDV